MNFRLRIANFCSDHTVLVGSWLKKLNVIDHKNIKNIAKVIKNGSNKEIFNSDGYIPWQSNKILKFVTHHWREIDERLRYLQKIRHDVRK